MHRPITRRQEIIRNIMVFTLTPLAVIALMAFMVSYMFGFRFDSEKKNIQQGGLLQVSSRPVGADVYIDGKKTAQSPTKSDLTVGSHSVSMERDGYRRWMKNITMNPGQVLWLNYARLIPNDIKIDTIRPYENVESMIVSPGGNRLALVPNRTVPTFSVEDITLDTPKRTDVVLPVGVYTEAKTPATSSFEVVDWIPNGDSEFIVKHSYDATFEWIVVNVEKPETSINLNTVVGSAPKKVQYMRSQNNIVAGLVGTDIRMINLRDKTVSAPVVQNVADFEYADKDTLTYVTTYNDVLKEKYAGYWTYGAKSPKQVRRATDKDTPLAIRIALYDSKYYVAVMSGTETRISSMSGLPSSESKDTIAYTEIHTVKTQATGEYLYFSPSARFVAVQQATTLKHYDLELRNEHTLTLPSDGAVAKKIAWLDDFTITTTRGGKLYIQEYDGLNGSDIMPINPVLPVSVSRDNKYIYGVQKTADGKSALMRALINKN